MGDEKAEGSGFTGGGVFGLKVQIKGLTKNLGTDPGFEFNNLVVNTELLVVGPGQRDGVVGSETGNDLPNVMERNVVKFFLLSRFPLKVIIRGHCFEMVSGLIRES